jgi:hypothetical protein
MDKRFLVLFFKKEHLPFFCQFLPLAYHSATAAFQRLAFTALFL